eukprot:TRINITY_DN6129_c0_g1_i1.p1 TRINITY_DN6129_c0_g1~~TRINITY_DN6129_c0_g1_i1.p1  ORF type:complete len:403 (-),score=36.33 TRINITY_DN6129_c0_g1_i1:43-1221(-)
MRDGKVFDVSLPSVHSYLGATETVSRKHILDYTDDRCTVEVPVLAYHTVFFPGAIVPLRVHSPDLNNILRKRLQEETVSNLIGFRWKAQHPVLIGTLAEIQSSKYCEDSQILILVTKTVARFRIISGISASNLEQDSIMCTIRLLPDKDPPFPEGAFLRIPRYPSKSQLEKKNRYHLRHNHYGECNTFTPQWCFRSYDPVALSKTVVRLFRAVLNKHTRKEIGAVIPTNPKLVSYWIARNLIIDNGTKQELLHIEGCANRLRAEIALLQGFAAKAERPVECVRCNRCGNILADMSDAFCMSAEGVIGSYVNESGYIHQTITLMKKKGNSIAKQGLPCEKDSWFPGYAWTIIICSVCQKFLGWCFTSVKPTATPAKFWGFSRGSITTNKSAKS